MYTGILIKKIQTEETNWKVEKSEWNWVQIFRAFEYQTIYLSIRLHIYVFFSGCSFKKGLSLDFSVGSEQISHLSLKWGLCGAQFAAGSLSN